MTRIVLLIGVFTQLTTWVVAEEITVHQLDYLVDNTTLPTTPDEIEYFKKQSWGKNYRDRGPVFTAENEPGEDRVKLRRWSHLKPPRHFAGFELPKPIPGIRLDRKFEVYVWKKESAGLIPVYCSTRPDGSDPFFTTQEMEHEERIKDDWEGLKIKRNNLKIVFYAKPVPEKSP